MIKTAVTLLNIIDIIFVYTLNTAVSTKTGYGILPISGI